MVLIRIGLSNCIQGITGDLVSIHLAALTIELKEASVITSSLIEINALRVARATWSGTRPLRTLPFVAVLRYEVRIVLPRDDQRNYFIVSRRLSLRNVRIAVRPIADGVFETHHFYPRPRNSMTSSEPEVRSTPISSSPSLRFTAIILAERGRLNTWSVFTVPLAVAIKTLDAFVIMNRQNSGDIRWLPAAAQRRTIARAMLGHN